MLKSHSALSNQQKFRDGYKNALRNIDAERILDHYGAQNMYEEDGELIHSCLIDTVSPHHNNGDSSPSASMKKEGLVYHCWSYGGGDILWFIQEMEDCDRDRALSILSEFIEDTDTPTKSAVDQIKEIYAAKPEDDPIPKYHPIILEPWLYVHPYMLDRGFAEETLMRYSIGYDDHYEQIVIPHFWKGKLVGYQKRRQDDFRWPRTPIADDKGKAIPKYKNSKGFPRDRTLFNYDTVNMRRKESIIVVESVMSVLRAETWFDEGNREWGNTLATFGGKVMPQQIDTLQEFDRVLLLMDNDPAGWAGTVKLYNGLKDTCSVRIFDMPEGFDLADLTLEEGSIVRENSQPGSLVISEFRQRLEGIKHGNAKVHHNK